MKIKSIMWRLRRPLLIFRNVKCCFRVLFQQWSQLFWILQDSKDQLLLLRLPYKALFAAWLRENAAKRCRLTEWRISKFLVQGFFISFQIFYLGSTSPQEACVCLDSIQFEDIESSINGPAGYRRNLRPIIYKQNFLEVQEISWIKISLFQNFEKNIGQKYLGILAKAKGLVESLKIMLANDTEEVQCLVQPTPDLPDEYAELDLR